MNLRKRTILLAGAAVLLTASLGFRQEKSETAKSDRANVLLRFTKDGTASAGCSQTVGVITQSILQVEGVRNAKMDAKNNGIQVTFDPGKTTPEKIVTAFNKENPDTPLRWSAGQNK
jgi:copper chaperone CopZ